MQVHGCAAKSQSLDLQVVSHEAVEAAKDGEVKVQILFSMSRSETKPTFCKNPGPIWAEISWASDKQRLKGPASQILELSMLWLASVRLHIAPGRNTPLASGSWKVKLCRALLSCFHLFPSR